MSAALGGPSLSMNTSGHQHTTGSAQLQTLKYHEMAVAALREANAKFKPKHITKLCDDDYAERGLIVDVWAKNLHEEFAKIMEIVDKYPYIAMDTEFPGVVARPVGNFKNSQEFHYQTLKCNVDLLRIIQLGLAFCDEDGNIPPGACVWQFNFKFSLDDDIYAQDSIDLLTNSGIVFKKHEEFGIDVNTFGEILMTSGIVLNDEVKWISFHSGYDYGYLLKVLTCQALPKEEEEFFELMKIYFPRVYDIKYIMKSCENLLGGLQKVADVLEVKRIGPQHQAGSDSLLTSATFFQMVEKYFENDLDDQKFLGVLYGLGQNLKQQKPVIQDSDDDAW